MGFLNHNAQMQSVPDDTGYWSYGGLPQASPQGSAAMIQPPQPAALPPQNPGQPAGMLGMLSSQLQNQPQMGAPRSPQAPQMFSGGGMPRMPQMRPREASGVADSPGGRLAALRQLTMLGARPKQSRSAAMLQQMRELQQNTRGYENLPQSESVDANVMRADMLAPRNRVRMGDAPRAFAGAGAVDGPGTGREDKINAMLSDGEYVMDAESVALLGDGSNKAGAQRLDELRERLRAHKGKTMAGGNFSPDAKMPEAYLRGGK